MQVTVTQQDWDTAERRSGLYTPLARALTRLGHKGYAIQTWTANQDKCANIRRLGHGEPLPDDAATLEHAWNAGMPYTLPATFDITLPTVDSPAEAVGVLT